MIEYIYLFYPFIVAFLIGYGFGSVPFGLVLCYFFGKGDVRKIGSGNIGATNVLRTGSKALAIATLVLDALKGVIAIYVATLVTGFEDQFTALLAGYGALLGHVFPVWLKFKGGKGVATFIGIMLMVQPTLGLTVCAIWLVMALIFRISSLAALTASLYPPIKAVILYGPIAEIFVVQLLMTLLIWGRHKANISRLLKGEEPKIKLSSRKADQEKENDAPKA